MKQIDRIRNMNAEELAEELDRLMHEISACRMADTILGTNKCDVKAWLESEVEE